MTDFDPTLERFAGIGLRKQRRAGNEQRRALKLKNYLRGKQGNRCFFCRRKLTTKMPGYRMRGTDATLEHLIMRVHGGPMSEANCVAACFACNAYRNHAAWGRVYLRSRLRAAMRWLAGRMDMLRDRDRSGEAGQTPCNRGLDRRQEPGVSEASASPNLPTSHPDTPHE
jgi:hypothetical protein